MAVSTYTSRTIWRCRTGTRLFSARESTDLIDARGALHYDNIVSAQPTLKLVGKIYWERNNFSRYLPAPVDYDSICARF